LQQSRINIYCSDPFNMLIFERGLVVPVLWEKISINLMLL
jgi:hypothetical protein